MGVYYIFDSRDVLSLVRILNEVVPFVAICPHGPLYRINYSHLSKYIQVYIIYQNMGLCLHLGYS